MPHQEIDDNLVRTWMLEKTRIAAQKITEVQSHHPGMPLSEALRHEGLLSKADLEQIEQSIVSELGLPRRIGSLEIVGELGRGGMGVVLQAHDNDLGRTVAVKVLPGAMALRADAAKRFARECGAIARLSHPRIVRLYRTGSHEGVLFAVMEFIRGRPLDHVIKTRALRLKSKPVRDRDAEAEPLSEEISEVLLEFAQMADALDHAHGQRIIHRDMKPSNVMVDSEGRMHVLDFGLAHLDDAERVTYTGDLLGTPLYMSPEQISAGRVSMDVRTDVYSLGATIYETVTLTPPFSGRTSGELYQEIMFKAPRTPSRFRKGLPAGLDDIILQCLQKDPDRRYASARDLASDLTACARGEPVSATRYSRRVRIGHALQHAASRVGRPGLALLMLAGALLLGLRGLFVDSFESVWPLVVSGLAVFAATCVILGTNSTADARDSLLRFPVLLFCVVLLLVFLSVWVAAGFYWLDEWLTSRAELTLWHLVGTDSVFFDGWALWDLITLMIGGILWMRVCLMRPERVLLWSLCGIIAVHLILSRLSPAGGSGTSILIFDVFWAGIPLTLGSLACLMRLFVSTDPRRAARWFGAHVLAMGVLGATMFWVALPLASSRMIADTAGWVRRHQDFSVLHRNLEGNPEVVERICVKALEEENRPAMVGQLRALQTRAGVHLQARKRALDFYRRFPEPDWGPLRYEQIKQKTFPTPQETQFFNSFELWQEGKIEAERLSRPGKGQ